MVVVSRLSECAGPLIKHAPSGVFFVAARHSGRVYIARPGPGLSHARAASCTAAGAAGPAVLARRLAFKHGVQLDGAIDVAATPYGLGMVCTQPLDPAVSSSTGGRALIRVAVVLVLSATLPGCSPSARAAPELRPLLSDSSVGWELQLAGMLLWACLPGGSPSRCAKAAAQGDGGTSSASGGGGTAAAAAAGDCREQRFWRQCATLLPPADLQTALRSFDGSELAELQVQRGAVGCSDNGAVPCVRLPVSQPIEESNHEQEASYL